MIMSNLNETYSNLKVGDRLVWWRLGYSITNSTGLPEHLREFYEVFTVERVNVKSFRANGKTYKYAETSPYWIKDPGNDKLERWVCLEAGKYLIQNLDGGRGWHARTYMEAVRNSSPENQALFKSVVGKRFEAYADKVVREIKGRVTTLIEEYTGGTDE